MSDVSSISRRELCRTGLRLIGVGGLVAGAAGLVCGRGAGSLPGGACGPSPACTACSRRRGCRLAEAAPGATDGPGAAGRGGPP